MITQDLIEVLKDSTFTFTHFIESKNLPVVPSTAFITILDSSGGELLAKTAMTINGTTGVCTYAWASTGKEVGFNYMAKYELDSLDPVIRLFDIMLYPFINNVTDDDLFAEYKGLKSGDYDSSGTAQSGTTTTLVDINRAEADDYWNGGRIELYVGQDVFIREITDFVLLTNTLTFTPALAAAVTTEKYTMRNSYQIDINFAGKNVQLYFKTLNKRAYLVIDSYTLKRLIIFEFFKQYFFELIKKEDDEYFLKHKHYAKKYDTEIRSLKLVYDEDRDGASDPDEEGSTTGATRWYR